MPGTDWKDELVAYMVDGDIRIDPDVHQEFGFLESRKYGWFLPMQPPTERYEWVGGGDFPTKTGHSYCVAREPESIDSMPGFINWTSQVIVLAASQGATKSQEREAAINLAVRLGCATVVGIILLASFLVIPFLKTPPA